MLNSNQKSRFAPGEIAMRRIPLLAGLSLILSATLPLGAAFAQSASMTGKVTSDQEGAMEGVLVSAKKAGSNITITVVTDKSGRFSFPASKIGPGHYELRIRAAGYELGNGNTVEVAGEDTTSRDIKLRRVEDMSAQLSNGEWMGSMPGADKQKGVLLNCVGCHTLERVARSTARRRRFHEERAAAHAGLRQPEHPAAPAASPRRTADGGARRFTRAYLSGDGGISRHHQSQRAAEMELRPQPIPPAGRPRHARHLHRIRPAARNHRAA
jgi:hypothetical protein